MSEKFFRWSIREEEVMKISNLHCCTHRNFTQAIRVEHIQGRCTS